ncbi:hypothetical protein PYW08_001812 [Mythimna loreyi]|uniref:Uncharacterized protein n=1 Tax=Mythimna loreyi TaxID=667449 RepID=A0ACC2R6G3_9NEOP|nr:hypothetical protein PYW08_001812 [Mythimna loreyi]
MPNLNRTPPPATLATPRLASPLPRDLNVDPLEGDMNPEVECFPTAEIQHYDSAPDLRSMLDNITDRKKRKYEGNITCSTDIIKEMFASLSNEQAARFEELQISINMLQEQNSKLTSSVELMSNKYDEFLSRISQLESERRVDKKMIETLEEKIEYLERKSRSTGIEIRNIPRKAGESKQDLCSILENVSQAIKAPVDRNCVKDIYRIKSKDSTNPIIVELSSVLHKDRVLDCLKTFNKCKKPGEKLSTINLSLQGPVKPIYISEHLTAKTQKLFYLARMFQQQHKYAFCWTSHGVVYLREKEKDQHYKITSEKDIETLRKAVSL